jgi:hypothetical protein
MHNIAFSVSILDIIMVSLILWYNTLIIIQMKYDLRVGYGV